MSPVRAVLFDLDMTLVDTSALARLREQRKWGDVYRCLGQTVLFPGVQESFAKILPMLKCGVVTSSPRGYAEKVLSFHSIRIPVLAAYHDTMKHKPHPEPLLYAARMLDVKPAEIVTVGDEEKDTIAGRDAGMTPVAVTYGVATREVISRLRPALIVDSFADIVAALSMD